MDTLDALHPHNGVQRSLCQANWVVLRDRCTPQASFPARSGHHERIQLQFSETGEKMLASMLGWSQPLHSSSRQSFTILVSRSRIIHQWLQLLYSNSHDDDHYFGIQNVSLAPFGSDRGWRILSSPPNMLSVSFFLSLLTYYFWIPLQLHFVYLPFQCMFHQFLWNYASFSWLSWKDALIWNFLSITWILWKK